MIFYTQLFALGMGVVADRLVRSTEANAELRTARPAGERPNNKKLSYINFW